MIRTCSGQPVRTVEDLQKLRDEAAGKKLTLFILRKQNQVRGVIELMMANRLAGYPIKRPCVVHSFGGCVPAVIPGQAVEPDEGGAGPI